MSDAALDVVEFLLTTSVYSDDRTLDENDLPPSFRRVYWTGGVDDENESDDGSGGNGGSTRKPAGINQSPAVGDDKHGSRGDRRRPAVGCRRRSDVHRAR